MTRRQLRARAIDQRHYALMLAYRNAQGGDRLRRLRELLLMRLRLFSARRAAKRNPNEDT